MKRIPVHLLAALLAITVPMFADDPQAKPEDKPGAAEQAKSLVFPSIDEALDCKHNPDDPNCGDKRDSFIASAYLGTAIDNFAADEVLKYLNPEEANDNRMRIVGGMDFEYRMIGDRNSKSQVWVYGETVHGVRSRDVDCKQQNNVKLPVCKDNLSQNIIDQINQGQDVGTADQFIAILRNASSLEAFVGVRWEAPPFLQGDTESPARWFVNGQLGFLTVSNGGGDVVDLHHIGVGAKAVNGMFEGSFLEVGVGRDDLFKRKRTKRAMVDGYLEIDPHYIPVWPFYTKGAGGRVTPFIEFVGDFDGGSGADSVQTYFGLNFKFGRNLAQPAKKN